MVFTFGGQNFSMIVCTVHYGTWNRPGPCPPGFVLEVPFEWSALSWTYPEAWERVKDAGWDKPLGGLNVVYAKEGRHLSRTSGIVSVMRFIRQALV